MDERQINEDITKYHKLFFYSSEMWTVNAGMVQVWNSYELREFRSTPRRKNQSMCSRTVLASDGTINRKMERSRALEMCERKGFYCFDTVTMKYRKVTVTSPLFRSTSTHTRRRGGNESSDSDSSIIQVRQWSIITKFRTIRTDCFQ